MNNNKHFMIKGLAAHGMLAIALVVGGSAWIPLSAPAAQTVSVDAQSLAQRLDRIDKRLQRLESHPGSDSGGATLNPGAASDLETRMQDVESENSQINGSVERLGNSMQQLVKKLDAVTKDMDLRLQDLESKASSAPAAAAAPAPAETPEATTDAASPTTPAPADKDKAAPAKTSAADDKSADKLTATEYYNKAYSYLTAADYPNAQKWFTGFIKKNPKDKLADNANYWLGEVYLVENNPTDAVKAFRNGLVSFPQGQKAPANLLKMGLALQQLKHPEMSKVVWAKLTKDFPRSPEAVKAKDYLLALDGNQPSNAAKKVVKP